MNLLEFVRLSEKDKILQEEIFNCESSQNLEKVLEKYKCKFTIEDIENVSRDLSASYWPWSEKIRLERKKFFLNDWLVCFIN